MNRRSSAFVLSFSLRLVARLFLRDAGRGQRMQQQITQLQMLSQQSSQQLAGKAGSGRARSWSRLLDEARRLTSSLADSAQKTNQLGADQLVLQGKIEELQRSVDALQKAVQRLPRELGHQAGAADQHGRDGQRIRRCLRRPMACSAKLSASSRRDSSTMLVACTRRSSIASPPTRARPRRRLPSATRTFRKPSTRTQSSRSARSSISTRSRKRSRSAMFKADRRCS